MKKRLKMYAGFTLLVMVCNFFMPLTMLVANASSSVISDFLNTLEGVYNNLDSKIEASKAEDDYLNNVDGYKEVIDTIDEEVDSFYLDYSDSLLESKNISINELLLATNSGFTLDTDEIIVDYNFDDLSDDVFAVITQTDLENKIIEYYFSDDNVNLNSYNANYSGIVSDYKATYNNAVNDLETIISNIDLFISDIDQYILNEETNGNKANLLIDGENVYDLLNNIKEEVNTYKNNIDLSDDISSLINDYNNRSYDIYLGFFNVNETWENNGIKDEIDTLYNSYNSLKNSIEGETSITDTLIDSYISIMELEADYLDLIDRINNYLEYKISDKENMDSYLENLNNIYNEYNIASCYEKIKLLLTDDVLSDNENIKVLAKLTIIEDLDEEIKEIIFNSMINFRGFKLLSEDKYQLGFNKDNIIIYNLINKDDLLDIYNNFTEYDINDESILYNPVFVDVDNTLSYVLVDDNYKLNIIINGDLNGNGYVEEEDLSLLASSISEKNLEDLELMDINNDGLVNMSDVVEMGSLLGLINVSEDEVEAKYEIKSYEDDNNVYYEIYLVSNGIVNGIELDVKYSSDLTFKEYTSEYNVLVNNTDELNILGYGDFNNGDMLLKLVFEKNNDSLSSELNINGNIYGNGNNLNIFLSDVISRNEEEKEVIVENTTNIIEEEVEEPEDIIVDEVEEEKEKDELVSEEVSDSEIIWTNVIKIVVVVLLGTLIIYFLNKDEDEDFLKDNKKDDSKYELVNKK